MRIVDPAANGLITSLGFVWDPIALDYVVATPAAAGGGIAAAVTIIDGGDIAEGSKTDLEAAAGNGSVIAILKRIRTLLSNPLAVTGAFFQATQPVSLAAAVDVSDRAARALGIVASITAAVDVSDRDVRLLGRVKNLDSAGAVIDPATKAQLPAALTGAGNLKVSIAEDGGAVIGVDDNAGSLTIDSPQLPAALVGGRLDVNIGAAVSLPGTVVDGGDVAQGAKADAVWDGVTVSTTISAVMKYIGQKIEAVRALIAGTLNVSRKIDQARVFKSIRFTSAAAPIADTICSSVLCTDGVDAAAATTFAVTAGKKFRVTSVVVSLRTTTAVTPWGLLSLRINPAGAAVLASPTVHWLGVGGTAAVIGNVAADTLIFPEGWEFSGTMQLALTFANNVATNVVNIVVHGYEYTP